MIQQSKSQSFLEKVQHSVETFFANLHISSEDVIRFVSCFGLGFLLGLLLKRYVKYLVIFVLSATLLLSLLSYFNVILVNSYQIKTMLGFSEIETYTMILNSILLSIQMHIAEVGCGAAGCLLGFKVG